MFGKYKNEKMLATVSANNYTTMGDIENDYFFSKFGLFGVRSLGKEMESCDFEVPYIQSDIRKRQKP